jgi:predicted acylesterase/phospholipase RssA
MPEPKPVNSDQNVNWGLVCQGGGGKGAWQAGFLYEAVTKYGVSFRSCAGTSVGALNAALYLMSLDAGPEIFRTWENIGARDILAFPPKFSEFFRFGIFGNQKMLKLIRTILPATRIQAVCEKEGDERYLFIFSSKIKRMRTWVWKVFCFVPRKQGSMVAADSFSSLHTALLASSAIPVIYPYVQHEDGKLWDGGLIENNPLNHMLDVGLPVVLVLAPLTISQMRTFSAFSWMNPFLFLDNQLVRSIKMAKNYMADIGDRYSATTQVYIVTPNKKILSRFGWFSNKMSKTNFERGQEDADLFFSSLKARSNFDLNNLDIGDPRRNLWEILFQKVGGQVHDAFPDRSR